MNRFSRDYALVREDGAIVWESHYLERLEVMRRELAEEGIVARVVKSDCEMCAGSKWKSACPECEPTAPDKIKYWWSEDRQFFCILVNDGTVQATVSLTVDEAESLMDEVMQTPRFLEFQKECADRALQMLDESRAPPMQTANKS